MSRRRSQRHGEPPGSASHRRRNSQEVKTTAHIMTPHKRHTALSHNSQQTWGKDGIVRNRSTTFRFRLPKIKIPDDSGVAEHAHKLSVRARYDTNRSGKQTSEQTTWQCGESTFLVSFVGWLLPKWPRVHHSLCWATICSPRFC